MISKALRDLVFERDSYTCVVCDRAASDLHHFLARSRGGRDTPPNLASLCRQHHDAIHGIPWAGEEWTAAEIKQAITEYLFDYYVPVE